MLAVWLVVRRVSPLGITFTPPVDGVHTHPAGGIPAPSVDDISVPSDNGSLALQAADASDTLDIALRPAAPPMMLLFP